MSRERADRDPVAVELVAAREGVAAAEPRGVPLLEEQGRDGVLGHVHAARKRPLRPLERRAVRRVVVISTAPARESAAASAKATRGEPSPS